MQQEQHTTQSKNLQIKDFTSALMSALGVKVSEDGDKIQSATIFLSKLYRKYSGQTGKKFNQIKLNRLNGFLYKVWKDQPTQKSDLNLIYHIILSFIYNEGSSSFDQNSFALNTGTWIAKFIEEVLALKQPTISVEAIQTLLRIKKPVLLSPDQFDKTITDSAYFKDKEISKEDETHANKKNVHRGFMSQFSIYEQVLNTVNPNILFTNLYQAHPTKSQIIQLFLLFCREVHVTKLKELFIKVFVTEKSQTKQTISAILNCLDSQLFVGQDFSDVLKILLNSNQRKIFYALSINNLKCQNRYLQVLMQETKPNMLDELAQTFMNERQTNNYYLVYLINKSNQKLPERLITLPLQPVNHVVTNRQAIICAMSINHNFESAHNKILKHFFEQQNGLTAKQKLDCLRLAHFSYIRVPKSHLLTQIIKNVSVPALDQQSSFSFLPRENYQKIQLDKSQREMLNDFLDRFQDLNDQVFWIKLDLSSACGKLIPYMQEFEKVQKILEAPIDQVLADLPKTSEGLLEVVLMAVNNKLDDQFMVSQAHITATIQWGLQLYKQEEKKFKSNAQNQLKNHESEGLLDLCLQIFYYNLDQSTDLEFDENFKVITSSEIIHKLNGLRFSEYFMSCQSEKNQNMQNLLKSKTMLIELKRLIRLLKCDNKMQNKKDLKTLISGQNHELRALRIIKLLSQISSTKKDSFEKLKTTIQSLLKNIKPDFQNFQHLSTKSATINISYVPIFESLEFLLKANYQTTISFLAELLKSRQAKTQDKADKKQKSKKKTEQNKKKNVESFIEKIEYCFRGDPNSLKSYSDILIIIDEIKSSSNMQNLQQELCNWVSRIKMFHNDNYKEWSEKVDNYVRLWEGISQIISVALKFTQIQRHFEMMIQMLRTLYEKHKREKGFLSIEKKLLSGIYILYLMAPYCNENDIPVQVLNTKIPKERIDEVFAGSQIPLLSSPHIYYCFDCQKKICHECSELIHSSHDKNFVSLGSQTQCHRVSSKPAQFDKKLLKEKLIKYTMKQGRQRDTLQSQLDLQKITKILKQPVRSNQMIYMRLKEVKNSIEKRNDKGGSNLNGQLNILSSVMELEDDKKKENDEDDEIQRLQIKSCSEKEFSIHAQYFTPAKIKPIPTFQIDSRKSQKRARKLNLSPLFSIFVSELKSNSFYMLPHSEQEHKNSFLFDVQISNEKYIWFKNDLFKYCSPRLGSSYFTVQQQQNYPSLTNRRNAIQLNSRFLVLLAGEPSNQLHFLDSKNIQDKFLKRESERKYKDNDTHENYQIFQSKADDPSVYEISFFPFNTNLIAEISIQKIVFKEISRNGRARQLGFEQSTTGQIYKFQWLRMTGIKPYFSYLTTEIVIGKISKFQIQPNVRITLPSKKIKDYCITPINSQLAFLTILDLQNKIYRSKIDVQNKKVPNFADSQIKFHNTDELISVFSQGPSIYVCTNNGKIIILNINEGNNLTTAPLIYSILDSLKCHKISETNLKFKQVTKITKLKYITRHYNNIILSCLLTRENANDLKKLGFFSFICLNTQSKKSKVILFNDQGTTDSYDSLLLNEKQFMFVCLQEDGQIWSCLYNNFFKTNAMTNCDFGLLMSSADVNKYAQEIKAKCLVDRADFYSKERSLTFKQNNKIADHFTTTIAQSQIVIESNEKFLRSQFLTGILFEYTHNPQQDGQISAVTFSLFDVTYKYEITTTRDIQISFSIKDTLTHFINQQPLKINFHSGNPKTHIKEVQLFGVKWGQKSIYLDSLSNLAKIIYIYKANNDPAKQKKFQSFLLNQYRDQIKPTELQQLEEYCKVKQFSQSEYNLLIKLELFRESIQQTKIDSNILFECFQGVRNYVLPNCSDRKQLLTSVDKLYYKLDTSAKDENAIKLGHALNYNTHLDIYNIFRIYKQFMSQQTIDNFQQLLASFCQTLNSHTLNALILLSVHPRIVQQTCIFFKKVLLDYKRYFRIKDNGLQQDQKLKLINICTSLLRIIIQNYQLAKNKSQTKHQNNEEMFLKILENLFSLNKKQLLKQIKLNPFKFIDSVFEETSYTIQQSPFNFLQIQEVNVKEEPNKINQQMPMIAQQQEKPKLQQNHSHAQESARDLNAPESNRLLPYSQSQFHEPMDPDYEEEYQQHKETEQQNRDMQEQYIYEIQMQRMKNMQKIRDEDEEQFESQRNQPKNSDHWVKPEQISTKKIYAYLLELSSNKMSHQITFTYTTLCENLIIEIFNSNGNTPQQHKYLTADNLVFYVGLVYNILLIIEKKLNLLFNDWENINYNHQYITNTIFTVIKAIDSRIDNPPYSVLYLPINSIIAFDPKAQRRTLSKSFFVHCLNHYYSKHMTNSNLLNLMKNSNWFPQEFKQPVTLNSVLRFQPFDITNPIYQLKFVGNMYLNLRSLKIQAIDQSKLVIKQNFMKAVVKYSLKVFLNIMIIEDWTNSLQLTKLNVAFEQLQKKPQQSLRAIGKSLTKDPRIFIECINEKPDRINDLQSLLGQGGISDQLILDILNSYYSNNSNN